MGNAWLDVLTESEENVALQEEVLEGVDVLTEGIDGDSIVLPEFVVSVITEALTKGQLDSAYRSLRHKHGDRWDAAGWTRAQLVSMGKSQKFLRHQTHLKRLIDGGIGDDGKPIPPGGGLRWGGIVEKNGEALIRTRGSFEYGPNQNIYQQTIRFANFPRIIRAKNLTWPDKARLLMRDRIKVHCDCPAFRYYYAYVANRKKFALYPELRPADQRNPKNKGGICKHLHLALQFLGAHNAKIASELKSYYEGRLV